MQVILTIGVSASGKSTWAAEYVKLKQQQNENWFVINQDDIRLSIIKQRKGTNIDEAKELKQWDYNPEGESENTVKQYWEKLVAQAISNQYTGIIISDTNLDGGVKKIEKLITMGINPENVSKQWFPISFEEALERDSNRKFSVGESVLKMQFDRLEKLLSQYPNKNKAKI